MTINKEALGIASWSRGQRGGGLNGHQQPHHGKSIEHYTPPEYFEAMGVYFDLDPASPAGGLPWIPARRFIDASEDGLRAEWSGLVWLNPPYGAEIIHWLRRMADHDCGIALVPARCNTRWWHETVSSKAVSMCQLFKRPYYYTENHERASYNSGADIVLVAYGQRAHSVLENSCLGAMARF